METELDNIIASIEGEREKLLELEKEMKAFALNPPPSLDGNKENRLVDSKPSFPCEENTTARNIKKFSVKEKYSLNYSRWDDVSEDDCKVTSSDKQNSLDKGSLVKDSVADALVLLREDNLDGALEKLPEKKDNLWFRLYKEKQALTTFSSMTPSQALPMAGSSPSNYFDFLDGQMTLELACFAIDKMMASKSIPIVLLADSLIKIFQDFPETIFYFCQKDKGGNFDSLFLLSVGRENYAENPDVQVLLLLQTIARAGVCSRKFYPHLKSIVRFLENIHLNDINGGVIESTLQLVYILLLDSITGDKLIASLASFPKLPGIVKAAVADDERYPIMTLLEIIVSLADANVFDLIHVIKFAMKQLSMGIVTGLGAEELRKMMVKLSSIPSFFAILSGGHYIEMLCSSTPMEEYQLVMLFNVMNSSKNINVEHLKVVEKALVASQNSPINSLLPVVFKIYTQSSGSINLVDNLLKTWDSALANLRESLKSGTNDAFVNATLSLIHLGLKSNEGSCEKRIRMSWNDETSEILASSIRTVKNSSVLGNCALAISGLVSRQIISADKFQGTKSIIERLRTKLPEPVARNLAICLGKLCSSPRNLEILKSMNGIELLVSLGIKI